MGAVTCVQYRGLKNKQPITSLSNYIKTDRKLMKAFISHSSQDKRFVRKLKADLNENGILTFFDEDSLEFGDSLKERLEVALDESTHFIIILSPHATESNWVKFELKEAINLFDKKTVKKIIPIKYRNCEIPKEISNLLYADLSKEIVEIDSDKVKFLSDGYGKFFQKLIMTMRSSEMALNKSDRTELKKEVTESGEKHQKETEKFIKIRHKVVGYKDKMTVEFYQKRIATAKKTTEHEAYRPIVLPPIYRKIFPGLKLGDSILFTRQGFPSIQGDLWGFKNEDTGITIHSQIRQYLGIKTGEECSFTVDTVKRNFIKQ